jgi:NAD(P)-dependent dehydrogenase (short-subunit alcohol dehydrogenase family)
MKTRARGQPKLPRKHPTHMGRQQRCVLVIGGAGGVGSGIVEALLERGRFDRVLASSREAAKLETLRTYTSSHRRLTCISGSVDDRAAADALLAEAQDHGSLDAVVACLGGWWEGPHLTELDVAQWDCAFASLLRPHFIAARTFVPERTPAIFSSAATRLWDRFRIRRWYRSQVRRKSCSCERSRPNVATNRVRSSKN